MMDQELKMIKGENKTNHPDFIVRGKGLGPDGGVPSSSRPQTVPHHSGHPDRVMMKNPQGVIRGRPTAQQVSTTAQLHRVKIQQRQEERRRVVGRKGKKEKFQSGSSGVHQDRKHIAVQTEQYLEEMINHIEDVSVACQTDTTVDKPSTPLYVPAKTSKDAGNQIEDGELFDFDLEVEPMLQVLIGKTMEQASLEVLREEELAGLRAQQRTFHELRDAEMMEVQRLEEQERRYREEKVRRINQQRMVLKKERETTKKIAARTFSQQYLDDLLPSVFSKLRDDGYFYDPVRRDIETGFLPWLMAKVNNTLKNHKVVKRVLDGVILDVANHKKKLHHK